MATSRDPGGLDADSARAKSGGARDSVDRCFDGRRIDAGARVGDPDNKGRATLDAHLRERRGGRLRVVDPEAEREAAGAGRRGAIEHDVVAAGERPHGARCEDGVAELGEVRIQVDRQADVPGEAVLVSSGDDSWLDLSLR